MQEDWVFSDPLNDIESSDDLDFGDELGLAHGSRFQRLRKLSLEIRIAAPVSFLGLVLTLVGGAFVDILPVVVVGALLLTVAYVLVALEGHRSPAGLLVRCSRPALLSAAMGSCLLVSQVYTSSVPA